MGYRERVGAVVYPHAVVLLEEPGVAQVSQEELLVEVVEYDENTTDICDDIWRCIDQANEEACALNIRLSYIVWDSHYYVSSCSRCKLVLTSRVVIRLSLPPALDSKTPDTQDGLHYHGWSKTK